MATSQVLWLNTSPSLQRFDQPLLRFLSQNITTSQWEYHQTQDEPCCFNTALTLLHDYLQNCDNPVHLAGHGTGGLLGLLYARQYPKSIQSLSLLSVGVHPAVDWQAHYYVHRQLLSCSRDAILTQMVTHLFGQQKQFAAVKLRRLLKQDLDHSLSPHTLFRRVSIPSGNVAVPLMVCGGEDDIVIDPNHLHGWRDHFKLHDRLWVCPDGGYFFHCFEPEAVGRQLLEFWDSVSISSNPCLMEAS
ncbi:MAG: alpha/beta hydrolase [Cyanobacteria bacterium RM1_2_2]|nr:alpha/beta hydrolase [Cyanobacteria bacterium RM1_2_2]